MNGLASFGRPTSSPGQCSGSTFQVVARGLRQADPRFPPFVLVAGDERARLSAPSRGTRQHACDTLQFFSREQFPQTAGIPSWRLCGLHPCPTQLSELFVRRLLFIEIGVEQTDDVVMAEAIGPGDQCPVPRNLVVFDRLR